MPAAEIPQRAFLRPKGRRKKSIDKSLRGYYNYLLQKKIYPPIKQERKV